MNKSEQQAAELAEKAADALWVLKINPTKDPAEQIAKIILTETGLAKLVEELDQLRAQVEEQSVMRTLDEMKLSVCEKLPKLVIQRYVGGRFEWRDSLEVVNWSTEGLQICHEAEKLLKTKLEWDDYLFHLKFNSGHHDFQHAYFDDRSIVSATYEQRLGSLCRVWWPERFV